jgi:4-alpha-glucanotransferase
VVYGQFLFFRQWKNLKAYANKLNLKIIGDIPIFIAHDSADAWTAPHLFTLNPNGSPSFIAGVPPDGFSATGQLWGNPHYRWDVHKQLGYSWWIDRIKSCLEMVDIIRLDHFIGFIRYFEIPGGMPTAEIGEWKPGPGADLFNAIKNKLGSLPIIAEDLGVVIPEVISLREDFDMPGMRILQFAFYADDTHDFLPHNYPRNTVAYTGVHDNDTTTGWFLSTTDDVKNFCLDYLGTSGQNIAWDMIRGIWRSIANMALAPMQDFLGLGTEARMNYPGRQGGNWSWRLPVKYQEHNLIDRIYKINQIFSRLNKANEY